MTLAAAAADLGRADPAGGFRVWSPGRVNLIGDHIDYSGGLVLPMALDRGTVATVFPRSDGQIRGYSTNFADDGVHSAGLVDTTCDAGHGWFTYVLAMVDTAVRAGLEIDHGFEIHLSGDIPDGGGLSSSASVEMAVACALEQMFHPGWDPTRWALVGQRAENDYVGVACGIMDQLAIARGRAGKAILMDCASLECRYVPVPSDQVTVLIGNTQSPRRLAGSAYNDRRAAVERAREILGADAGLATLASDQVDGHRDELEAAGVWRETRHTVSEQARVVAAAAALACGDVATVGRLMRESHESLRDDFRVTGEYLDALVSAAWQTPGVIGARMTGAGFGGCTVNLVQPDQVEQVAVGIARRYAAATGITPEMFAVAPSAGAHVLD